LVLGGSPAWAQAQEGSPGPASPPTPPTPAAGTAPTGPVLEDTAGTGQLKLGEETAALPLPVMLKNHEDALTEMREGLKAALAVLKEARGKKDIVLLNCVNERISLIKGVLKVAEAAGQNLQEHAATGNADGARVSYTQVMLARERIKTLKVQAQNCVGAESYYGGETEVVTDINPEIAGGDPFFGDRGVLDDPRQDYADGPRSTDDNTNPETPTPPPPSSVFQP
jgi:hypothetical protein